MGEGAGQEASLVVERAVPRVTLRNWFAHPYDSAIAAARTCYASRLISPEEITDKQRTTIGAKPARRTTDIPASQPTEQLKRHPPVHGPQGGSSNIPCLGDKRWPIA